jgi:hypothetical protein
MEHLLYIILFTECKKKQKKHCLQIEDFVRHTL